MAKTAINVGRQTVLSAVRTFNYEDFTVDGSGNATINAIHLKPGTRILRGWLDVTTAWDSGTTATLSVGDTLADDVDKYLTATTSKAAGITELDGTPVADGEISTAEAVTVTLAETGTAATAGEATLFVEYVESPRCTEFHTYRG